MQNPKALHRSHRSLVLGLALASVLTVPSLHAETPPVDHEAVATAVQQSFDDLARAVQSLDIDQYLSFFDRKRFTALNADGTVCHSFGEFEEAIRRDFPALAAYESLEFDRVKITVLNGGTAILVNEYRAAVTLAAGGTVTAAGAGTQVWNLIDGDWKLVSVSSSARPQLPATPALEVE